MIYSEKFKCNTDRNVSVGWIYSINLYLSMVVYFKWLK